jgi:hypothetical protein
VNTIQINYDLVAPGRDYSRLFEYLRSYGTRAKPLRSMWFVKTNKSATQVRDEVQQFVDGNDKVVTVDVTDSWWGTSFSDEHTQWMRNNMVPSGVRRAA